MATDRTTHRRHPLRLRGPSLDDSTGCIAEAEDDAERKRAVIRSPHLVVTGASPEHIIAMKMRAGTDIDREDIGCIAQQCGIESADELESIHAAVFPEEGIPERSKIRLRERRRREERHEPRSEG